MFIPARSAREQPTSTYAGARPAARRFDPLALFSTTDDDRIEILQQTTAGTLRLLVLLLGLLPLRWAADTEANLALLGLAWLIGIAGHFLWTLRYLSNWAALVADSVVISLLLCGANAEITPLVGWLPLALVVLATILCGGVGALAGGLLGAAALSIAGWATHSPDLPLLRDSALVAVLCGVVVWPLWHPFQETFLRIRQDAQSRTDELRAFQRALAWQREITQLIACETIGELQQRAAAQAMKISGAGASVELVEPGGTVAHAAVGQVLPIRAGSMAIGRLAVEAHDLSAAQTDALQSLATIVGLRATTLDGLIWREQIRGSLDALWQLAGALRFLGADRTVLYTPCARIAEALRLDWIALLAPDASAPIAPVMLVYGRDEQVSLSPAQLRVAAEALRGERPLVRREGRATLACLPVLRAGQAPLVIAARGEVADDASQAILMLLGDLLARRFDVSDHGLS